MQGSPPVAVGLHPVVQGSPPVAVGLHPVVQGSPPVAVGLHPVVQGSPPVVVGLHPVVQGSPPVVVGLHPVVQGSPPVVQVHSTQDPPDDHNAFVKLPCPLSQRVTPVVRVEGPLNRPGTHALVLSPVHTNMLRSRSVLKGHLHVPGPSLGGSTFAGTSCPPVTNHQKQVILSVSQSRAENGAQDTHHFE